MKDMNVNATPRPGSKPAQEQSSDEEDEDQNDPDNYPDAERDDVDEEGLKRRYKNALREQGIQVDDDDPTVASMLAQARKAG
jgi:hypothetical protein